MEQMQEEFEKWAKEFGFGVARFGSGYDIPSTNYAWQAWQASRQALVFELPPRHEFAVEGYDGHELIYALNQAGIKWKE